MAQGAMEPRRLKRRDSFFGLHFDLHPQATDTELGADITEEMIARLLEKVKPDFVQYDCKGHAGYTGYPTRVGWPSPGIVQDSLALWRKVTREHGVGLYIHYSGVWDTVACQHHPEWARVTPEGQPDPHNTSPFGPYVDELLIPQLKEVADAYDLDGAWIDGECWAVQPDYGEAARAAFAAATGITDPPKKRGDPGWAEWLEFHRERFREYVRHYVEALHAHRPTFQIASNWMYTSFMPEPVTVPVDYLSGDYSPGDSVNTARLEARYLASVGMPWDLMAWGFNKGEQGAWSLKTAVQLQQEAAVVLAQGGGFQIYYQPTRAGWIDDWMVDIMAEVAAFCRARQAVSHSTETVPQVALLLSGASFYAQTDRLFSPWGGELTPVQGTLQALLESHYSVDLLAEHHLRGRLGDYPVIVLPECPVLPDDFRDELLYYVSQGGQLLAIGAATALFQNELGVTLEGEPTGGGAFVQARNALAYLLGPWQAVTPTTAEPVGWRFPNNDSRKNGAVAATIAPYGQGQIAAIYGPLGRAFMDSHHPVLRYFLGDLMSRLFPEPMVTVEGPPCLDVSLRRRGEKQLIHLANTANMQVSPRHAVIDFVPPVGPVKLSVRWPQPPRRVLLASANVPLEARWEQGLLGVTVPEVAIHEVVVIEGGRGE